MPDTAVKKTGSISLLPVNLDMDLIVNFAIAPFVVQKLTDEVRDTDTAVNNVEKLTTMTRRYTRIDELTPEILNAPVNKIVVHEAEKKKRQTHSVHRYLLFLREHRQYPRGGGNGSICRKAHNTENRLSTGKTAGNFSPAGLHTKFVPIKGNISIVNLQKNII